MEGEEGLGRGLMEDGFGEVELFTEAGRQTGVAGRPAKAGGLSRMEKTEEANGSAKEGDLGGP